MHKRFLIVDDNDALRDMLYDLFRDDADILTATNGQEALELIKKDTFDIILTDYNMPVMSGIEFLKEARKIDSETYLHSILLTGSNEEEIKSFCELNCIPLIVKPFSILKLKGVVNMVLEASGVQHIT